MPTIITRGSGSAQGFGYASSSAAVNYVEDVFSTYLYTGDGSTQTITNGIDLSTKSGLTWIKGRTQAFNHTLVDTVRGATNLLVSNTTAAQATQANSLTAFTSTGFSIGAGSIVNYSGDNFASWTFREQPKFFDIVTYTGTGSEISMSHSLGSIPGMVIVKRTDTTGNWFVRHRGVGGDPMTIYTTGDRLLLNSTGAAASDSLIKADATTLTINNSNLIVSAGTYVAYLFAHDAGGFGLTGTDNVISCGSFTTDGSGAGSVTLGYEPQWVMHKRSDSTSSWQIIDNMRGMPVTANSSTTTGGRLYPNLSNADDGFPSVIANATGFTTVPGTINNSATYIYIAIRRGPMEVPTVGTQVFSPIYSAAVANTVLTTSFPVDLQIPAYTGATIGRFVVDRLRGVVTTAVDAATSPWMKTNSTDAETTGFNITRAWDNTGYQIPQYLGGATTVYFNFGRAPGFFDEVVFTAPSNVNLRVTHNLTVVPELIFAKDRNGATHWVVYSGSKDNYLRLNSTLARTTQSDFWGTSAPTATDFGIATGELVAVYGDSAVAYLFATCPGVSKVGSYTGTGTTLQINCGFTAGSRFVLIKRTDSTGDWYVWDSARGIVAGNDPYLLLNSTAAEVTGTDYVDTYSAGFEISSTAPAAINANGGAYIFLAIA